MVNDTDNDMQIEDGEYIDMNDSDDFDRSDEADAFIEAAERFSGIMSERNSDDEGSDDSE